MLRALSQRFIIGLLPFLLFLCITANVQAQDSWTKLTGTNNWNTGANWASTFVPVSGPSIILNFTNVPAGANYWSTNDIATVPFVLNQLTFSNANPGGGTITLRGNQFALTNNGATAAQVIQDGIGPVVITDNIILRTNTFADGIGGGNMSLDGIISGSGMLIKNATNRLTLTGANTYTGGTIVSNGILRAGNTTAFGLVGSTNTVSSGGTIDINAQTPSNYLYVISGTGVDNNGALVNNGADQVNAIRRLALSADASVGGTGRFDLRNPPAMLDLRGFTLTKSGTKQFSVVSGSISNGSIVVDGGTLSIESSTVCTGSVGTISINSGATLFFYANTSGLVTRPIILTNGATITAGLAATNDSPITLKGYATNNAANYLVLNGPITESGGSYGFTKTGASTLLLTGTNTFTGAITNNAGVLQVGNNGTAGSIIADVYNNSLLTFSRSDTYTNRSFIWGTGVVTKAGSGTLLLTNANSYLGGTIINSGTLIISNNNALGMGNITFNTATSQSASASALILTNKFSTFTGNPTFGGSGNLRFAATNAAPLNGNRTIYVSTATTVVEMFPAFSGGGNILTKDGAGMMVLYGSNTHSGGTTINGGLLGIGANNVLGTGTLQFNNNSTIYSPNGPQTITNALAFNGTAINFGGINNMIFSCTKAANLGGDRTMSVTNAATLVTMATAISGTNALTKTGPGTLILTGTNAYTGYTGINGGTLDLTGSGVLGSSTNIAIAAGVTLVLENINDAIGDGAVINLKSGAGYGRIYLTNGASEVVSQLLYDGITQAPGTYGRSGSGATYIDNAHFDGPAASPGILVVGGTGDGSWGVDSDGNWGDSLNWTAGTIATGAWRTAYFTNNIGADRTVNQNYSTLALGGLWFGSPNSFNWTVTNSVIYLTNNALATPRVIVAANTATIGSTINGAQGLTKDGAGTLVLNSANGYTGNTTISNGVIRFGTAGAITDGAGDITVNGTLDLNGYSSIIRALAGTGTVTGTGGTIIIGTNNTGGTFSGSINGALSLTKTGTGTETFTGTNNYSGITTVNGGFLVAQNNLALGNSSGVTVGTNSTLRLNNSITVSGIPATLRGLGNDSNGALSAGNGVDTWDGNITLGEDQTRLGAQGGATLVINGVLDSGANIYGPAIRSANVGDTILLNGVSTYAGTTTVVVGTLKIGNNNRLPVTSLLALGNGANAAGARFDLNGFNQQVAGLANLGTTMEMAATNSYPAIESAFTISNDTVNTYAGRINGNITLVKAGAGIFRIAMNNYYYGSTRIAGAGSSSTSVLEIINGGYITYSSTVIVETNAQLRLSTTNNVLNDSARIALKSGGTDYGTIYLTNGVNEVVGSLFFDDVLQAPGTWGGPGNGISQYTNNNRFAGAGVLNITGGGDSWNVDNSGTWSNSANWLNGVVATGAFRTAYFTNDITADRYVSANYTSMNLGGLYFGSPNNNWYITNAAIILTNYSVPMITVTANTATLSNAINSAQGLIKDGAGTLNISGIATCGVSATVRSGVMNFTNGTALRTYPATFALNVGDADNKTGTLNVVDNLLAFSNNLFIAAGGNSAGNMNISGASTVSVQNITLGSGTNSTALMNIAGSSVVTGQTIIVGNNTNSVSTLNISGSAILPGSAITIANSANSTGTLNISNGTVNAFSLTLNGATATNSTATLNLVNGTLNVGSGGYNLLAGGIVTNRPAGATSQVLLSGGTFGPITNYLNCPVPLILTNSPGSGNITIRAAATNNTAFPVNLFGGVSGPGNLIKTGTGALYLSDTNVNYTGDTTVSQGTLVLENATITGSVSIAAGATLALPGGLRGDYYNVGMIQTGAFYAQLTDLPTFNSFLATQRVVLVSRSGNVGPAFDFANSGNRFPVPYNAGVANFPARWTGKFNAPVDGLYTFFTASDDGSMLWIDGNTVVNNNFSQGVTERSGVTNLTAGLHDIVIGFYQGGGGYGLTNCVIMPGGFKQRLDNSLLSYGAGNTIGSLSGAAGSILSVSNDTLTIAQVSDQTFAGTVIGSAATIVKTGPASLALTGAGQFSGSFVVSNGILNVAGSGTLGASQAITVKTNGQLVIENTADVISNTAAIYLESGDSYAKIYLTNGVNDTIGVFYIDGVAQAAGTWGMTGSGCTYTNDNFFDGPAVNPGVLTVLGTSNTSWGVDADGNWNTSGNWTNGIIAIGPTATAYFTNAIGASRVVSEDIATLNIANLSFGSPGSFDWTVNNNIINLTNSLGIPSINVGSNSATISSVVTGLQGVVKSGPGTLVLSGVNTYNGGTTIAGGTLSIGASNNLGVTQSGVTLVNGGTLQFTGTFSNEARNITINTNGTFDVAAGQSFTISNTFLNGGAGTVLTKTGAGTLVFNCPNNNNNFSGLLIVNGGTNVLASAGGGDRALRGNAIVNGGGTLRLGNADVIENGRLITINGGGLFDMNSVGNETIGFFAGSGTVSNQSGTTTLNLGNYATNEFSGMIYGSGSLVVSGNGIQVISGTNRLTGNVTVQNNANSVLAIASDQVLSGMLFFNNGAAIAAYLADRTVTNLVQFNGDGRIYPGYNITFATNMNLNGGTRSLTVSNNLTTINGSLYNGSFTKMGMGTLVLTGTNGYTGATAVSNGIMVVQSTATIALSTSVTVEANAQLTIENTGNVISDNAIVTLRYASGAYGKLYLTNTVDETVRQLYFDGTLQTPGTYGSSASAATYQDDNRFAGTGVLRVQGGNGAWITDGSSDWSIAGNWRGGMIPSNDISTAYFTNSISADVSVNQDIASLMVAGLWFGSPANNWSITNNPITLTNSLGIPLITVNNGAGTVDSSIYGLQGFTKAGTGTLALSGTNNFAAITVSGGTLAFTSTNTSTSNNLGQVTVNGGAAGASLAVNALASLSGTSQINLGSTAGDRATMVISTNLTAYKIFLGNASGAAGAAIQNGGVVNLTSAGNTPVLSLPGANGGYGYYRMVDGILNPVQIEIGATSVNGIGVFDMIGGTASPSAWNLTARALNGIGVLNVYGGTIYNGTANNFTFSFQANQATFGMLNVLNSGVMNSTSGGKVFEMSASAGNVGSVVNLLGGTLIANKIQATNPGSPSWFNFNGGVLQANPAGIGGNGPLFMTNGMTAATIYSGGAIIDSAANIITISEPLLAPVGNGLTSVTLSDNGAGYIGPPVVNITGGGGTGATAIAQVDLNSISPTFGQVTNILITSPGYSYIGSPIITLSGGGYTTPANVAGSAISSNIGGGLIKLGTGILIFNTNNTYSGSTIVSNGILDITAGGSITSSLFVSIEPGAQLTLEGAGNMLSDDATVNIATNGSIYLTNGINETVYKLNINGQPALSGTWGRTGSGAANIDDVHFTGSAAPGTFLTVTANDGAWMNDADGDWSVVANWTNGTIAAGTLSTAYFTNSITGNRSVNQDYAATLNIANLWFGSPLNNWIVTNNTINLTNAVGTPVITVSTNTATIASAMVISEGLVKSGAGTLVFSNNPVLFSNSLALKQGNTIFDSAYITNVANVADYIGNAAGDFASLTLQGNGYYRRTQNSLILGNSSGITGIMYMTSGTMNNSGNTYIGYAGTGSVGAVYQTGGVIYNNGEFDMAFNGGGGPYGFYLMTGGVLSNNNWEQVGRAGYGLAYQYGGSNLVINAGFGFVVGNNSVGTSTGVMYFADGYASANRVGIGWNGTSRGEVTIAGNAIVNIGATGVMLNQAGTTRGVLNLNGGVLQAQKIFKNAAGGWTVVNFNGGIVQATASTTFMGAGAGGVGPVDAAYIRSGGAIFDSSNFTMTVAQQLTAASGWGVTNIPWGGTLVGYVGAPYVEIAGGNGTGATAIALFDYTSGSVTGVVITSPGANYQSGDIVTAILYGGGNTNYGLGTAALGANAGGGLVKLGTGTLNLITSANTYSGGTIISNGVLSLGNGGNENTNGLGTGLVTITGTNSTLKFTPGGIATVFAITNDIVVDGGTVWAEDGNQHLTNSTITVTGNGARFVSKWQNKSLTLDSLITGSGNVMLLHDLTAGDGSRIHITNPGNTYSGTMTITNAGSTNTILYLDNENALTNATINVLSNGGLVFNNGSSFTIGGLAGTGNFALTNAIGAVTLLTGNNNSNTTWSGAMSGTGSVVKTGTGTLSIAGTNSYTGSTTISNGTVDLVLNGAIAFSTNITVETNSLLIVESSAGNAIGNAATLVLKAGPSTTGRVYITNGVIETIGSLYFDTSLQAPGSWGSSASFADNKNDDYFAGSGILRIGAFGSDGSWSNDVSGSAWSVAGNWTNNVIAIGEGRTAYFTNAITGDRIVNQDSNLVYIGNMTFGTAGTFNWTITNSAIMLVTTSGTPVITVNTNTTTVSSAIIGNQGFIKSGPGTLVLSGTNSYSGTTRINAGTLYISDDGNLGASGAGLAFGGGTLQATNTITFSNRPVALNAGAMFVIDGALTITNNVTGANSLTKTGSGSLTLGGVNAIGAINLNAGSMTFSGNSTNNLTGNATVNNSIMTINGPVSLAANYLVVGNTPGSRSAVAIGTNVTVNQIRMGTASAGAAGAIYQTNGIVNQTSGGGWQTFAVGDYSNSFGYYGMSGGALIAGGELMIGAGNAGAAPYGGDGVFDMSGGTVAANWVQPCRQGTGQAGLLNVSGGTWTQTGNFQCGRAGSSSLFTMNIMNSGIMDTAGNNSTRVLDLMNASGNHTSIVNVINGGELIANRILLTSASGRTVLNFNGGTLQANPAGVGTLGPTFLAGLTVSTIYSNGAFIDTGTNVITISQPLMAPAGYGITNIDISSAGTGYIGTPVVFLSGGSGTGATAIAQVDLSAGTVTNILITSPGSGYQSGDTVTATLRGGGYITPAAPGAVTLNVNVGGGLTKLGSGLLRLTGTNTWSGNTTISNGTLNAVVSGALGGTTNITITSGALLIVENPADVINNGATVDLKTGSTLYLTNGVFDTIAGLSLDGTPQLTGIWGAPGNVIAQYTDARITGAGLLLVGTTTGGSSWNNTINGNWSTAGNWNNSVIAFGYGETAFFTNNTGSDITVTQDYNTAYIGNMTFGSPGAFNWTVSSNPVLMVGATTPVITVNTNTATVSAVITGSMGIAKAGAGTLVLNAANTYTGVTRVNNGTLVIGATNTLPTGTTLSLGDTNYLATRAGILDLGGNSQTISNLATTSVSTNNATVTNAIINIAAGEALNIVSSAGGNVVNISEGTHLQVSGAGTMNVVATNGTIFIWGRRTITTPYWGMDLSQLASFSASVSNITIGYDNGAPQASRQGLLALAETNDITAASVFIGNSPADGSVKGQLLLGISNVLNIADLHIGYAKTTGYVDFNTGVTGGQLFLQGTNGTRGNVYVGEFNQAGSGTQPNGFMTITNSGCSISAQLNLLGIGLLNINGGNPNAGGYGSFVFNSGIVDANIISLGRTLPAGTLGTGSGTFTMNGGLLIVNTNLIIGQSATGSTARGYFTINDGTATVQTVTIGDQMSTGAVVGSFSIAGGTFNAQTIKPGAATASRTFSWINGTIRNYDAGTDLVISNLSISLDPAGTHTLSVDVGRTAYITSTFTNNGNLVKAGAGTMILYSNNSYSGSTIVSNGVLDVTGVATLGSSQGITVETGAQLTLEGSGNMISDSATVYINGSGMINLPNVITETVGTIYTNGVPLASGTYGATGSGAAHIDDVHFSGAGVLNVQSTDGIWAFDGNGDWSIAGNWTNGLIPASSFSTAYFTNAISADVAVNQDAAAIDIGGLWFGSPANNWSVTNNIINMTNVFGNPVIMVSTNTATIGSVVTGLQGIVKQGAGTLVLTNANTYSGQTIVSNGTLYISDDANLGAVGAGLRMAGAALEVTNSFTLNRAITLTTNNTSSVNTFNIDAGSTLTVTNSGVISGGTWVKTGPGAMTFNSAGKTWNASGIISNGTVLLQNWNGDGFGINSGNIIVCNGGVLTQTVANAIADSIITVNNGGIYYAAGDSIGAFASTDAGGTINLVGGITLRTVTSTNTFSGRIIGANGLTINVKQVLAGSNTYSGTTIINGAGVLTLANTFAAQNSTVTNGVNGGLQFGTETNYVVGSLIGAGNFALTNADGNAVQLTFGGNNYNGGAWNTGILSGSGSIIKTGSGQAVFSGANTFSGGFTLGGSGTIIPVGSSTGNSGPFGTGLLTLNGAPIRSTSGSNTTLSNEVIFAANTTVIANNPSRDLEFAGPITLTNGTRTLTQNSTNLVIFSGIVDDKGLGYGLIKSGSGTLVLSKTNSYGGITEIATGNLNLSATNALPVTTILRLGNASNTGAARVDLAGCDQLIAGLTNLGTTMLMEIANSTAAISTLTVSNALDTSFGGLITTNISLVKAGAGMLSLGSTNDLAHTNTYIGSTIVNGGTLQVDTNALITFSTNITVYTNAQLTIMNTNNVLSDSASVYLASGATVYLTNGVSETVDSLYIDGVPAQTGSWGTVNCQWTNTSLFAGSGILVVTSAPYSTLTVSTAYGAATPAGITTHLNGSNITASVTTPVLDGTTTQFVCIGWTGTGSVTNGIGSSTSFILTNNSILTWLWDTNFMLTTSATNGSIDVATSWQLAGSTPTLTATASNFYHFTAWTGTTSGCPILSSNQITATMDQPRWITALFDVNMTTNANPTPEWWLNLHFGAVDYSATADLDSDGDTLFNWQEYIAGTDPTNVLSKLEIVGATPIGTNYEYVYYDDVLLQWGTQQLLNVENIVVQWSTSTGRFYRLFASTNLTYPWSTSPVYQVLGDGTPMGYTNEYVTNSTPRFFRVNVSIP